MAKAREKEEKAKEENTHMAKEKEERDRRAKTSDGMTEEDTTTATNGITERATEEHGVNGIKYQRNRCGARFAHGTTRHATQQNMMTRHACSQGAAWKDKQSMLAFGNRGGSTWHTTTQ